MRTPAGMAGAAAMLAAALLLTACGSGADEGPEVNVEDGTLTGGVIEEALDSLEDLPEPEADGELDYDESYDHDIGGTGVADEIAGIWYGDDGSVVGIDSASTSGTGAAYLYLVDITGEQCVAALTETTYGWTTGYCEPDIGIYYADVARDGESLLISWNSSFPVTYTWYSDWSDADDDYDYSPDV